MIFNIFKSKPTLKELIPKGFVDIHSHILPGIDDGAKNIKESLKLIKEMKELGFVKIIGTPHTYQGLYNNTNKTIKESYRILKGNLKEKIKIDYASEYMIDESLIKKIENKSLLTIDENHVLVEMSFISQPNNLYDIIFQLILNNYTPILAHPERYSFLFQDFKKYYKLKKVGCKFQINLLSTTGYYGKIVSKICDQLLKGGLIDFVGSDIHNKKHINAFNNKICINEVNNFKKAIEANNQFI